MIPRPNAFFLQPLFVVSQSLLGLLFERHIGVVGRLLFTERQRTRYRPPHIIALQPNILNCRLSALLVSAKIDLYSFRGQPPKGLLVQTNNQSVVQPFLANPLFNGRVVCYAFALRSYALLACCLDRLRKKSLSVTMSKSGAKSLSSPPFSR